ncbi:response regulator [Herpetosiphon llansteffanensis]|uniref:response regulator n=1 Tax=Herpetosiphon llansteffanensis TaxID=2094568 RepID=UPI000D7C7BE4|nr:response regulator [Herpetosiphon llansteffanensis]
MYPVVRPSASPIVVASRAKVMVIEDNVDSMNLTLRILREQIGVAYCNARPSGDAFFSWLNSPQVRQNPILSFLDLILLDIRIPRENGHIVFQKLRALPELKRTKVVAMTANGSREEAERARVSGFHGFIAKPISVKTFPDQIARVLSGELVWDIG